MTTQDESKAPPRATFSKIGTDRYRVRWRANGHAHQAIVSSRAIARAMVKGADDGDPWKILETTIGELAIAAAIQDGRARPPKQTDNLTLRQQWARKGGLARAAKLDPERRKAIARAAYAKRSPGPGDAAPSAPAIELTDQSGAVVATIETEGEPLPATDEPTQCIGETWARQVAERAVGAEYLHDLGADARDAAIALVAGLPYDMPIDDVRARILGAGRV